MRKKLLFRTWLLLALLLAGAGSAWGEVTYDFTLANFTNSTLVSVNTDNKLEGVIFNPNTGNQNKIDCYQLTNPNDNLDLEGHFYVSHNERWYYSKNGAGLWQNDGNRALLIAGLAKGQIVSINFTGGSGIQKMGIRGVSMNKLDGSSVDAGDYIESNTKYVAASDGYISLLCSKDVFIKSITIEDAPNIYFTSNTGKDLTTENEEVELTAMSYTEPTLNGVPDGATVAWSVSNIRLAGFNWEKTSGVNHDILFINTGTVSVTATVTYCGVEFTASYTVIVSADNASYEVNAISGGGYEYTLTGKGKLQERVITSIPCMTMTFGANGGSYRNSALSAYSLTNITIVRDEVIDNTFVTTTIDENGWGHCWTVNDDNGNTVPYQGTFYKFEPTANGKLIVKGYLTNDNTAYLVDATDNYNIVKQVSFADKTLLTVEADLISGHTYYLYGNTPDTGVGTGWSKFLLNSFSFTSDFRFENAYYILQHGETSYSQAATGEATYSVERKGGVTGASVDNNGNVTNIQGENGAIIVTATNTAGASIYYVITVPSSYTEDVTYDFYTDKEGLGIADYQGDENDAESQKWAANYKVRQYSNRELNYLNGCVLTANKSIAGDNARYIPKTAGLVFTSAAKNFGTNAINTGTYESTDGKESYEVDEILKSMLYADVDNIDVAANAKVTIYYNSTFTIPQVPAGKIIKIYWQCYDSNAGQYIETTMSNSNCYLTDMDGTKITSNFGIGKAVEYVSDGNNLYKGANYFTVQSDNEGEYTDVTFRIADAGWTNIIRIDVLSEAGTDMTLKTTAGNTIGSTNSAVVYDGVTPKSVDYKAGPNYAGNAMMLYPHYSIDTSNGNLNAALTATAGTNNSWYDLTLTVNSGVGTAKIIQTIKDASDTYVLDGVVTHIPVGILSTDTEFPKTWDFTSTSMGKSSQYDGMANVEADSYGSYNNEDKTSLTYATTDVNSVNINVNQHNSDNDRTQLLFASGSELTVGTTAIEEAKGVGFGWGNQLCAYGAQNNVKLTDNGVEMNRRGGTHCVVTVPSVPANSRVYIKSSQAPERVLVNNTAVDAPESSDAASGVYRYDISTAGTVVVEWKAGVTVKKLAVTDILKDVNHLGFASESRNHNIDHSLNTELTSNNVKAYAVTADDVVTDGYNAVKVNLTEANQFTVVPSGQGVVLWNGQSDDQGEVFKQPLFYPAMHIDPTDDDNALAAEGKNMMVGKPDGGEVGAYDDNYANYIMAYRHYTYDSNTGSNGDVVTEKFEAFYPVMNAGTIGANKAYLHIDKSLLPTPIWEGGTGSGVKNMIYIGYIPEEENENDEPTGINLVDNSSVDRLENAVWYNLSGQQLNGRPATSGVYIVNGKKVMIK